jgi:hypothetical protein
MLNADSAQQAPQSVRRGGGGGGRRMVSCEEDVSVDRVRHDAGRARAHAVCLGAHRACLSPPVLLLPALGLRGGGVQNRWARWRTWRMICRC